MEQNKLVGMVVTITVAIILAGSLLVPVLSDQAAANDTFTNDGFYTYDAVTSDTDVTITWEKTNPGVITIGETEVTMPTGNGNWTVVGSENFTLRFIRTASYAGFQCYGANGFMSVLTVDTDSATIAVTSATMIITKTVGDTDTSKSYNMGTHGFVLNPDGDGDLTLKHPADSAYILGDSEIYLCGTTYVTGSGTNDYVGVFGYGTYDDLTMSSFYGNTSPNTVSFGDVTATYTEVDSYINLYTIEKFEFELTQNSASVDAIYSYFVVPTEVTAERAVHFSSAESAMILVIPVLVIVAILMMAVVMIRRD